MTLVIPLSIRRLKPILHKLSSQPRGTKRQAIKLMLLLCQIFTWSAALTVQAKLQFSRDYYQIFILRMFWICQCRCAAGMSPFNPESYQLRSIVGRKIESTVNTQLSFSFSTPPSTVNSQQSTIIPVQPELISVAYPPRTLNDTKTGNCIILWHRFRLRDNFSAS